MDDNKAQNVLIDNTGMARFGDEDGANVRVENGVLYVHRNGRQVAALSENGLTLTGGGALIRGLDRYLSDTVKLPVFIGDEPLLAVAKGTGKAIEELDTLHNASSYE